eukprot:TRINITY_DN1853_c0_g1_i12.p1 TRINITY_DN1853_c0_g1~~TRINITY_DN1853_c0_g1_i12.p1  ORF type:complete len:670 (-),score=184.14 TRINITY_DN1853_c0_g1_i12:1040-3049(-)
MLSLKKHLIRPIFSKTVWKGPQLAIPKRFFVEKPKGKGDFDNLLSSFEFEGRTDKDQDKERKRAGITDDVQKILENNASLFGENPEQLAKSARILTLKNYQKRYIDNPSDLKNLYHYLRELNRNEKYDEVVRIVESNPREYQLTYPWAFLNSNKVLVDIKNQYTYASSKLSRRDSVSGKKKGSSLSRLLWYTFLGYLVWTTFLRPTNEKIDAEEIDESSGLLGSLFGKFAEPEGERNIKTRFSDVVGIDEFKEELQELVDYLKNPTKYIQAGAKIPKGILLVGPPGTGKTLLARALAGEAGCSFFYKSGSEFDEVFVGMGARRVRELFRKARSKSPAIIFLDEIDSLAGRRVALEPSYARDTINQILAEMDGFKQTDNIIVIGATNMEEALDPAVKRPGRFDKTIHIPVPDVKGREEIFQYYMKKIRIDAKADPAILARQTTGFTGADIQNMCNLAILNAIKQGRRLASTEDFEYALDRITMGIGRKKMVVSDQDKLLTAYHEGGHALASLLVEGATPLHKVTILPRGGALGYTAMLPEKDELNMNRKTIQAAIDVALGGRAAEEIIFGREKVTTGCSSDLKKATELAYLYVRSMGMNEDVSLISSDKSKMSDKYNYIVDCEVQKLLKTSLERVKDLLKENENKLQMLAIELIRKETISADEIRRLLNL